MWSDMTRRTIGKLFRGKPHLHRCGRTLHGRMTFHARHLCMAALQNKSGHAVIERCDRPPAFRRMARGARLTNSKPRGMRRRVAGCASGERLGRKESRSGLRFWPGMTSETCDGRVLSRQGEFRRVVLESPGRFPGGSRVTRGAIGAQFAPMPVGVTRLALLVEPQERDLARRSLECPDRSKTNV